MTYGFPTKLCSKEVRALCGKFRAIPSGSITVNDCMQRRPENHGDTLNEGSGPNMSTLDPALGPMTSQDGAVDSTSRARHIRLKHDCCSPTFQSKNLQSFPPGFEGHLSCPNLCSLPVDRCGELYLPRCTFETVEGSGPRMATLGCRLGQDKTVHTRSRAKDIEQKFICCSTTMIPSRGNVFSVKHAHHIFIDLSNITIGIPSYARGPFAKRARDSRLNCAALLETVMHGRSGRKATPLIYGSYSKKQQEDAIRHAWKETGAEVHLSRRAQGEGETFVDDALTAQMGFAVLDSIGSHCQHKMVLLSGDGNNNYGRASFKKAVDSALRFGWQIEIWAWKHSISSFLH